MEDIQMKFILISMMLANPITYADKATCLTAVDALKQIEAEAVCIPAPIQEQNASDKMVTHMMKMIKRLEQMKIDLSEVNSNSSHGGFQGGGTTKDALR